MLSKYTTVESHLGWRSIPIRLNNNFEATTLCNEKSCRKSSGFIKRFYLWKRRRHTKILVKKHCLIMILLQTWIRKTNSLLNTIESQMDEFGVEVFFHSWDQRRQFINNDIFYSHWALWDVTFSALTISILEELSILVANEDMAQCSSKSIKIQL